MRKEYLRSVAEVFLREHRCELKDFCFVFPNKRSSIFFKKYLGEEADVPIFSPDFTTINELFGKLAELVVADKITLLYYLYLSYKEVNPSSSETFDDFIHWGDILLNDFDDIDKYMVDAQRLFANIKDLNEIDDMYSYLSDQQREAVAAFWGVYIKNKEKENEKKFISLWEMLYSIYTIFKERLKKEGLAYEGMIYRQVAQGIIDGDMKIGRLLIDYSQIVFVGMNALNKCEKTLFDYLQREGRGDFYWDYYSDVIKDEFNKSSLFMSDNVRRYHSKYQLPEDGGLPEEKPVVNVISVPSAVGGVKCVHNILKDIVAKEGSERATQTAVVLPDENMLFPLLNSIPQEIDKINVTMGYSLSNSNIGSLFRAISSLHLKYRTSNSSTYFYHKGVLAILTHPFVRGICPQQCDTLKKEIFSKNMIYVPVEKFLAPEVDVPLLRVIFKSLPPTENGLLYSVQISSYLKDIIDVCAESQEVEEIDREFLLGYLKVLNLLSKLQIRIKIETYFKLLSQLSSTVSIPFSGEPLQGLQIMGPLETRSLDFDNVIMMSMNEGIFPSVSVSPSIVPYNLRRGFDLPTYEYLDSISAYHFYRSISRAKSLYFIHDSRSDALKSNELSRYIMQMEFHHGYKVEKRSVQYKIETASSVNLSYPKNEETLQRLKEKSYSPSALAKYKDCPLQFYFTYIANIKEEEEVTEEIDTGTFGSIFHYVMEHIYDGKVGKSISKSDVEALIEDKEKIRELIREGYKEVLQIEEIEGKNIILSRLFELYVENTLKSDKQRAPFTVIATEKDYAIDINIEGISHPIRVKGIVDRIDEDSESLYVCDYKTGSKGTNASNDEIKDKHLFQLFYYLMILRRKQVVRQNAPTKVAIYYTKDIHTRKMHSIDVTPELYETFYEECATLFKEIFDKDKNFEACEVGSKCCEYCSYKLICRR